MQSSIAFVLLHGLFVCLHHAFYTIVQFLFIIYYKCVNHLIIFFNYDECVIKGQLLINVIYFVSLTTHLDKT